MSRAPWWAAIAVGAALAADQRPADAPPKDPPVDGRKRWRAERARKRRER